MRVGRRIQGRDKSKARATSSWLRGGVSVSSLPAAALAFMAWASACAGPRPQGTVDVPPELTFENLEFRVFRGAVLTAQGTAMHATFRRDTADLAARQVATLFPATSNQPEARITAGEGRGNLKEHAFTARNGVRAEQAGQVATTSTARYSAADGLVRGDEPVEIRSSRMTAGGPGFTLDPKEQSLQLLGGARAVTRGRSR